MTTFKEPQLRLHIEQENYVQNLDIQGLAIPEAFAESMRYSDYRDSGWAVADLVDNSIEADAKIVLILTHTDKSGRIDELAIVDAGLGMIPSMVGTCPIWGAGTKDPEGSRFGRFGFGLGSASVNIGRAFTVYSNDGSNGVYSSSIDLDAMVKNGTFEKPVSVPSEIPEWIAEQLDAHEGWTREGLEQGTIIHIQKVDRLNIAGEQKSKPGPLQGEMVPFLGRVFQAYMPDHSLYFNNTLVEPIDPLFTTSGFKGFDEDDQRATVLPDTRIEVKSKTTGEPGLIRIRYSELPAAFAVNNPARQPRTGTSYTHSYRWRVMNATNGFIVSRNGREIDVLSSRQQIPSIFNRGGMRILQNNDRYWKLHIDFTSNLDEDFGITTTKQKIVISNRVWEILNANGVGTAVTEMRNRTSERLVVAGARRRKRSQGNDNGEDNSSTETPAESAAAATAEQPHRRGPDWKAKKSQVEDEGKRELKTKAKQKSDQSGVAVNLIEEQLEKETEKQLFKIELESNRTGDFYFPRQLGGQTQVVLNTAHPFYTEVYESRNSTPEVREGIGTLLLAMAQCELFHGTALASRQFYENERKCWSERLQNMLEQLPDFINKADEKNPEADDPHVESGEGKVA